MQMRQLFQNAKIQDLNVIHNRLPSPLFLPTVVSECKDTRFECNSQPSRNKLPVTPVVSECKDTRFECNSQPETTIQTPETRCFRMQRYKI